MIDAGQSRPSFFHWVFYGPAELRAGWRLLMFVAVIFFLTYATNLLVRPLLHGASEATFFLVHESMSFLIFLLASWSMGGIEGRTLSDYGLPWRKMFGVQFWQGVVLGFASITVLLLAMRMVGVFSFGSLALHGADIWKWALIYVLAFILVALREEFGTRGYGLFTLSAGIGFWPAAIVSAVIFGYAHHGNSGEDWIGLFNVAGFGLLACLLLRRTGNLWMPIGLHAAFDWGETYFYGVANSGHSWPGHLLNSSSSGPAWLSGGTVGPEGSVLLTVLMIVTWLLCARWLPEVKYPRPSRA